VTDNMADIEVRNDSSPLKYATILPNMAEDDLDPYEYRLLSHYTRWYNDGRPHREGIRDTAEACQMSVAKVRSTRKELAKLGYITFEPSTEAERRQGIAGTITVVDRWLENMQRFSNDDRKPVQNSTHPPVSNMIDKREVKKEQKKKIAASGEPLNSEKNAHVQLCEALMRKFGLEPELIWKSKSKGQYTAASAEMRGQGLDIEDIPAYWQFLPTVNGGNSITIGAVTKHAHEYAAKKKAASQPVAQRVEAIEWTLDQFVVHPGVTHGNQ
jgi:hypothetical protein